MKKTAPKKKLTLSRETLTALTSSELKKLVLGGVTAQCTTSRFVCCN